HAGPDRDYSRRTRGTDRLLTARRPPDDVFVRDRCARDRPVSVDEGLLAPQESGMTVTVTLAAEADRAAWDAFVVSHPDAAGYHEWAWRDVFERAFGHTCRYLV